MTIIEDKNQKQGKHKLKNAYWQRNGIEVLQYRLPVGDYALMSEKMAEMLLLRQKRGIPPRMMDFLGTYNVAVDTKNSIGELAMNLCGKSHDRVKEDYISARNNGIQLIILVENKPEQIGKTGEWNPMVHSVEELHKWRNPRLFIWERGKQKYPTATRGITLQKACMTMIAKYGVRFEFCAPEMAGQRIIELLTDEKIR